jgi:hypothetical protein
MNEELGATRRNRAVNHSATACDEAPMGARWQSRPEKETPRRHYARRVLSIIAKQAPKTSTFTTIVAVVVVVALFALFIFAVNKRR